MSVPDREFSHIGNFTGYMDVVARHFAGLPRGLLAHTFSAPPLFSRSLVLVLRKETGNGER